MLRLALLVAAVLALAACGGDGAGEEQAATATSPPAPPTGVELEAETLEGETLALADLRGTPVFVNVWASW